MSQQNNLPKNGFLRLKQIIQMPGSKGPALIPVSRTTFLKGVREGRYPAPIKLGARSVAWRVEDIRALIEKLGGAA